MPASDTNATVIATDEVKSEEETKPLPKRLHSIVRQRIIALLVNELGMDVALPELALAVLDVEGRQIVPDVVVAGPERARFENGVLTEGADVAVEIMSPKQSFAGMIDKCERMLIAGAVPVCWILWPEHRSAYFFDLANGLTQQVDSLAFHYGLKRVDLMLADVLGNLPTAD